MWCESGTVGDGHSGNFREALAETSGEDIQAQHIIAVVLL